MWVYPLWSVYFSIGRTSAGRPALPGWLHDEISRRIKQCKTKEIEKVEFTQIFSISFVL